nr:MAG TPA: hypothetical protein [Bacteriophage sp.]
MQKKWLDFFSESVLNDVAVVLLLVKGERKSSSGRRQTDDSHTDT